MAPGGCRLLKCTQRSPLRGEYMERGIPLPYEGFGGPPLQNFRKKLAFSGAFSAILTMLTPCEHWYLQPKCKRT